MAEGGEEEVEEGGMSMCLRSAHRAVCVPAACRTAVASEPNGTEPERRGGPREPEPAPGSDYEEEEYEEAPLAHQYLVGDLVRGEPREGAWRCVRAARGLSVPLLCANPASRAVMGGEQPGWRHR